jgi:hypothetical protein
MELIDFTPLVLFGIGVLFGFVAPAFSWLGETFRQWLEERNWSPYQIEQAAEFAVKAAEQMYAAGEGEAKKAQAMEWAEAFLKSRGIRVDLEIVEAAIEAAVYELKNK